MDHIVCVCCGNVAVAVVEIAAGLDADLCADHLARRLAAEERHGVEASIRL